MNFLSFVSIYAITHQILSPALNVAEKRIKKMTLYKNLLSAFLLLHLFIIGNYIVLIPIGGAGPGGGKSRDPSRRRRWS